MSNIHPTAIIEPGAKVHDSAKIGAYSYIDADVTIGANCIIYNHVNITGVTEIGEGTHVFPFASLGTAPQDLKYAGEKTKLVIGRNNRIREHVTMNTGTTQDEGITSVGDNNLFMVGAHVAHDCRVGNNCILANNATIAGHVVVEDFVIIGGLSAVHQWVRIGKHAMIGGATGVDADVIPYGNVFGERGSLQGLNLVGLKRRGFERDEINSLRSAFKRIFEGEGSYTDRVEAVKAEFGNTNGVVDIVEFLTADTSRAICKPAKAAANG